MIQTLIGQKINQTQKFLENGRRIPVTEISVEDNMVVQVRTEDVDNYTAVQLGYGAKKKATKALMGHANKAKLSSAPTVLREVAWNSEEALPALGDVVTVDAVFKPGDSVQVTGTSKGKGFAGVMKRHNFRGGPKTHGQSDRSRAPGSIGQTTTPGRVYKGKRMAGRMGTEQVTVQNLVVVDVDSQNKTLWVLGLIPGHKKATVFVTKTGEDKKFVPLYGWTEAQSAKEAQVNEADRDVAAEAVNDEASVTVSKEPTTAVEAAAELAQAEEVAGEATEETKEVKEPEVKEEKK